MGSKLATFASSLLAQTKPNEIPVLEMDAAAQEVVEEYILVWLRSRIMHNKKISRKVGEDEVYTSVTEYLVNLNSAFFYARLWSESGVKENILPPLIEDQSLLDFVYRGSATLHARVFGKSNDTVNVSFTSLAKHIADSMCLMSSADSDLIPPKMREVFPHYAILEEQFMNNPWLMFIYYLGRIDIVGMVEREIK